MSNASASSIDNMPKNLELNIRVILLGRSGEGKSALGNLILGCQKFKTGAGAGSVTRECESSSVVFNNRELTTIDTPGCFDTKLSNEDIAKALTDSYYEAAPGPHAFLIVTTGRHTVEAEETLILLVQLFGESVVDYCIVMITHEDDLKYDNTTLEEYLGNSTSQLRSFVNKCSGRCIAVNSKTKDSDERKEKLTELLECIDNIYRSKHTSYYTHELFEKAAQDEIERRQNEEQRVRYESGEKEIRIQENNNLQKREEEAKKKQSQQEERLEVQRRNRNMERDNHTSENGIGTVFGSLFVLTLKTFLFVLAIKNTNGNLNSIGYRHFQNSYIQRPMFYPSSPSFTRDNLNNYFRQ